MPTAHAKTTATFRDPDSLRLAIIRSAAGAYGTIDIDVTPTAHPQRPTCTIAGDQPTIASALRKMNTQGHIGDSDCAEAHAAIAAA